MDALLGIWLFAAVCIAGIALHLKGLGRATSEKERKTLQRLFADTEPQLPTPAATSGPSTTPASDSSKYGFAPESALPGNQGVQGDHGGGNARVGARLFGACVLIVNLWLIGRYDIAGIPVLLLTFGFAIGFEFIVVRKMPL